MNKNILSCCKCLMIIFGCLVTLCGGILVGVGIWGLVDGDKFSSLISNVSVVNNAVITLIVLGCVVFLAGFIGCTGAIKESKCLLGLFFSVMLLLFIAEFVIITLLFVYFPRLKDAAQTLLNYTNSTKTTWDSIQSSLQCCGFTRPQDWESMFEFPPSCCSVTSTCSLTSESLYSQGCEVAIRGYFWIIGGIAIGVLVFELLAMIFTCCLHQGISGYEIA